MRPGIARVGVEAITLLGVSLVLAGAVKASGFGQAGGPNALPATTATLFDDAYTVTAETVASWSHRVIWVDARSAEAYAAAHAPGALHLNEDAWDAGLLALLETVMPGDRVVVYCSSASCGTSREVAERLRRDLATEEVYALIGGWEALATGGDSR